MASTPRAGDDGSDGRGVSHTSRLTLPYAAKLAPPPARVGSIVRETLIGRLQAHPAPPIVSIVAPPGYGKTTLLRQWAEHDAGPFVWLTLDARDDDPRTLLGYLALALERVVSLPSEVFSSLGTSQPSLSAVLGRLLAAAARAPEPVVVVLDDICDVQNPASRELLDTFVTSLPHGWRVAIAGREHPWLPVPRLRAEGRTLELGADDLAMDDREAAALLEAAGTSLTPPEIAELNRHTEGWAAALYLVGLVIALHPDVHPGPRWPGGDDRYLADYLRTEVLSRQPASSRAFLMRTSLLERLTAPLCDAVLHTRGSAKQLADLERRNLLVIPLDHEGTWYRYHHLLRDLLQAELRSQEPDIVPVLRRRAADWYEEAGLPELAAEQAMEVGDTDRVAGIAARHTQSLYQRGRAASSQVWFDWLDERDQLDRYPAVALIGALVHLLSGEAATAERWTEAAERGAEARKGELDSDFEGMLALVRAMMCREGPERMLADAETADRLLAPGARWRAAALLLRGIAHLVLGQDERADILFEHSMEVAEDTGATVAGALALAQRALLALARGDLGEAGVLAQRARRVAVTSRIDDYGIVMLVHAVAARVRLARREVPAAKEALARAQRLRPHLTHILPFYAVQARLELVRCYLTLTDVAGARTVLREAEDILRRRPYAGTLTAEVVTLKEHLDTLQGDMAGSSSLTVAELRLLPLLATHLSFRQIGQRLYISPNTVKTEAISIYRKLGVSSRSEAMDVASAIGLL